VTVFIVEISGCEFGGVEPIAFDSREKAEAYVAKRDAEQGPVKVIETFNVLEVEVQ
jgi:hypothetical protein